MAKTEVIGYEGSRPQVNRKDHPEIDYKIRGKKTRGATQGEFLNHWRSGWGKTNREVHSDGFLAISNEARECKCGGCCTRQDGYVCPRCGENNGT